MTTFERVIAGARRWRDVVQCERDLYMRLLQCDLRRKCDHRAALERELDALDRELVRVDALIATLEAPAVRNDPVLVLEERPHRVYPPLPAVMAKATLPARHFERRSKPRHRKVG